MILFRRDQSNEDEYDAAKEIFGDRCTRFRTQISPNSKVFGRYSVLPKTSKKSCKETARSSYQQHNYIADMLWYEDIEHLTPTTWFHKGWKIGLT